LLFLSSPPPEVLLLKFSLLNSSSSNLKLSLDFDDDFLDEDDFEEDFLGEECFLGSGKTIFAIIFFLAPGAGFLSFLISSIMRVSQYFKLSNSTKEHVFLIST